MVAAEAIVQTASKKERCSAIISSGIPILKELYESPNDNIKARALVVSDTKHFRTAAEHTRTKILFC